MPSTRAIVVLVATVGLAVLTLTPAQAAPRVVLFEQITNYGCPPCADSDPIIAEVLHDFGDQVSAVKWHVWWPVPNDPFYLYNSSPVDTRVNYYGVMSAPDVLVGGVNGPNPFSYESMETAINNRLAIPAPIAITCGGDIDEQGGVANIWVDVDVETATPGNDFKFFVCLAENYIYNLGPNGYPHHEDVFRWMNENPTPTGEAIDLSAVGLQQFTYQMPFDESFNDEDMGVRVFVQNSVTRDIVNAGKADLLVPYLLEMELTSNNGALAGPSDPVGFTSDVHNLGFSNDTYDVTIAGVPAGWLYSYTTPDGTFTGPSSFSLDSLTSGTIDFTLDSNGNPGTTTVTLTVTSQGNPSKTREVSFQKVNSAQVLVVDADSGGTRDEAVGELLTAAGAVWGRYDMAWGPLTTADMETGGDIVFWIDDDTIPTLNADDRAAIMGLMDNGGKILLSGQEFAFDLADPGSPNFSPETIVFFATYMHAFYVNLGPNSFFLDGIAGDEIGDGMSIALEPSGAIGQTSHDAISPGAGADLVFRYENTFGAAIKWTDGNTQLVYTAFGIEGVFNPFDRQELVDRILAWFGFEASGISDDVQPVAPRIALSQNVPNPFRPATTITYDLRRAGNVNLQVFDVSGRLVRDLVQEQQLAAQHEVVWDGTDNHGRKVSSGVYFYRLEMPEVTETRRMVLTR